MPDWVPLRRVLARLLGCAAVLVLALPVPATGQDAMSAETIRTQVAERFGVEVLRITESDAEGRPVYVVTVMNPAGDYNAAFQVTRLMIDRATGELISQFRHGSAGYELPGGPIAGAEGDTDGPAIRRQSLGEPPG